MLRSKKIRPDPDWASELRTGDLSFLFSEHGAVLLASNFEPASFGSKTALIQVGHLRIIVSRDVTLPSDYVESRVASVHAPTEFRPIAATWMALNWDQNIPPTPPYREFGTLPGLARNLRESFPRLNEAFSEASYSVMKKKIDEVEKESWRRWQENQSMQSTPKLVR